MVVKLVLSLERGIVIPIPVVRIGFEMVSGLEFSLGVEERLVGEGRLKTWSNYKTGSQVKACFLFFAAVVVFVSFVGWRNSWNENSARLIIFTYCKTPSRLYQEL